MWQTKHLLKFRIGSLYCYRNCQKNKKVLLLSTSLIMTQISLILAQKREFYLKSTSKLKAFKYPFLTWTKHEKQNLQKIVKLGIFPELAWFIFISKFEERIKSYKNNKCIEIWKRLGWAINFFLHTITKK